MALVIENEEFGVFRGYTISKCRLENSVEFLPTSYLHRFQIGTNIINCVYCDKSKWNEWVVDNVQMDDPIALMTCWWLAMMTKWLAKCKVLCRRPWRWERSGTHEHWSPQYSDRGTLWWQHDLTHRWSMAWTDVSGDCTWPWTRGDVSREEDWTIWWCGLSGGGMWVVWDEAATWSVSVDTTLSPYTSLSTLR